MLSSWGVKAGMAFLQVKLCDAISERFRKCIYYLKAIYKRSGLLFTFTCYSYGTYSIRDQHKHAILTDIFQG